MWVVLRKSSSIVSQVPNVTWQRIFTMSKQSFGGIAIAWAKKYEIIDENIKWYKEEWEKGNVFENMKWEVGMGLSIN